MEHVIEVSELTKYYGDFCAVDHISFNVEKGEVFGFLGPNGAGKTTTIRMLLGLTTPSEGSATVAGHDIIYDILRARLKERMLHARECDATKKIGDF